MIQKYIRSYQLIQFLIGFSMFSIVEFRIWFVVLWYDQILSCGFGRMFGMIMCIFSLDGSWLVLRRLSFHVVVATIVCSWVSDVDRWRFE